MGVLLHVGLAMCLTFLAIPVSSKSANDITSNEIDQPGLHHHISGDDNHGIIDNGDGVAASTGSNRLFAPPFLSTPAMGFRKSPKDDINVLAGAFLDGLLDHKAAIITSVVNLLNWLLGGLLTEVRDFADRLLGRQVEQPHQAAQQPPSPSSQRSPSGFAERRDSQTALNNGLFTVPYTDRPITYDDIQLLERLVYDSVEVYRAWQDQK